MRFAIVSETYPPEINGVALTVASLEQGLRDLGHAVELARPRRSDDPAQDPDTVLVRSAPVPRYPGLRFGLPCTAALRARWARERPDAIYIATEGPLGWSALRAARRLAIPAATGFHTRFDDYAARYGMGFLTPAVFSWLRRFHNQGAATLVPTDQLAGFLASRGFLNVVKLSRAVDTTLFHPSRRDLGLRKEWGLAEDDLAVVHVGRIAPEKNLSLAVSTFRALQAQRPDARYIWVGDGPSRGALQRENPDFIFAGLRRGDDLARHFASADLFPFPSTSETFGNVTLEAMASGVATVAYDYGAAREHIRDRINGRAIEVDAAAAFTRATVALASDDATRAQLARVGRHSVEGLCPASVSRQFEDILAGLARTDRRENAA
ncbi:glycosyltransferase family 4 protein [Alkalisalibacterium limincola]|uniref:Glycosyltransferase family 1 protein n=1 Tax=Alkalisalibacterium limincola TaxID=2699169 RepID=A0A5C8KRL8_9GAMM|nr:glycosyltransferase family 1 protein [Alkalisalibacterium limincola]TXK62085.1 glycosyltransferase family 1 protein [Alkalisalibacterium limincola]